MSDTRALLTSQQVAERFNVHVSTVSRWVRNGWLAPATRTPGGRLRFSEESVAALVETGADTEVA